MTDDTVRAGDLLPKLPAYTGPLDSTELPRCQVCGAVAYISGKRLALDHDPEKHRATDPAPPAATIPPPRRTREEDDDDED